jgi:hypothetical protein
MVSLYSTVRKYTNYNNIGTPGSTEKLATAKTLWTAGTTATAETPATAGMKTKPGTPTTEGNPATVRTSGSKGAPAAAEMLATSGTQQWFKQKQQRQEQQRCQKQYWHNQLVSLAEIREKLARTAKFRKKIQRKRVKIALFGR